eukprot:gene30911-38202_t
MSKELGYDANNIIGMPYDWRLAPSQMESRDSFFTTLKFKIQSSVRRHGRPSVVIAFSMGNLLFQYFVAWLEIVDKPRGGHLHWLRKHIWGYVGYSAPLLGAPMAVKSVLSGHPFGLPITDQQARELLLTCPSTHYLSPRVPEASGFDPVVSISGVCDESPPVQSDQCRPLDATATCDTNATNAIPKETACNGTKTFSVADVESGAIFKWIGETYPDSRLTDKLEVLQTFYRDDPVFMRLLTPYRRPPVRHVMMIYGVDVATEIGYNYAVQNHSFVASITPISSLPEWMTSAFNNTFPSSLEPLVEQQANPLVLQETLVEDSSCLVAMHKHSARIIRDCSPDVPLVGSSSAQSMPSFFTTVAKTPCTTATGAGTTTTAPPTEPVGGTCKAEIFAVRSSTATVNPLDYIAGGSQNTRRLVSSDSQPKANHSGDGTVPYGSLSHARKWLDRENVSESQGSEFNWRYNGSTSWSDMHEDTVDSVREKVSPEDVEAMKERVGEFKDILKERDEATDSATDKTVPESEIKDNTTAESVDKTSGEVLTPSGDRRWRESRPARIHKHFLNDWGAPEEVLSVVSSSDPAVDLLYSVHTNGDTTTVMEVSGIDHPEVLKNAYVHEVMFRQLLEKMGEDLSLGL